MCTQYHRNVQRQETAITNRLLVIGSVQRSGLKPGPARPTETRPMGLKYGLAQAPPASAGPGRILGSVPSVTGQTGQMTRTANPTSIGATIVRRRPRLLALLDSTTEL